MFFKKKIKPAELVKGLKDNLSIVAREKNQKSKIDKAREESSKNLDAMKQVLYGTAEHAANPDLVSPLANEVYVTNLIPLLITNLHRIEFEAKKDAALVFNSLLRRQVGVRSPTVEYITRHPEVLDHLVAGCENLEIALNCGNMLRECVRHEPLANIILSGENFYKFFKFVEMPNFDVASDGFATFKDLLTKHKQLCAEFLEKNYTRVFTEYTTLLHSDNYVTKRQSLKLLGELLLDRANFNVMTKYISQQANLKLMMNLLRDKSRSIQFEAFHVFKVFVANPNKPQPILEILVRNKAKLIKFLTNFHKDRGKSFLLLFCVKKSTFRKNNQKENSIKSHLHLVPYLVI
mmetsp:Transcript_28482/g.31638  ORF Transcript_28482/g.31638 Transcript_28482/m.31638 type:complete len:348 (-) Transcript_28482:208-1251(-)